MTQGCCLNTQLCTGSKPLLSLILHMTFIFCYSLLRQLTVPQSVKKMCGSISRRVWCQKSRKSNCYWKSNEEALVNFLIPLLIYLQEQRCFIACEYLLSLAVIKRTSPKQLSPVKRTSPKQLPPVKRLSPVMHCRKLINKADFYYKTISSQEAFTSQPYQESSTLQAHHVIMN